MDVLKNIRNHDDPAVLEMIYGEKRKLFLEAALQDITNVEFLILKKCFRLGLPISKDFITKFLDIFVYLTELYEKDKEILYEFSLVLINIHYECQVQKRLGILPSDTANLIFSENSLNETLRKMVTNCYLFTCEMRKGVQEFRLIQNLFDYLRFDRVPVKSPVRSSTLEGSP
jgi:hypothetical protein